MPTFTVPAGALAPATHFAARWLHPKPAVPVHGGILFEPLADGLVISGFGENVTARATAPIRHEDDVPGAAFVVSGRLVDALCGTLADRPVRITYDDGAAVTMTCGSWRGTLPVLSAKDYPTLSEPALLTGYVDGAVLADAVRRVAVAASRDMTKQIALTGLHITFDMTDGGATLTLVATDTLRAARMTIPWRVEHDEAEPPYGESALPFAATIADAVDAFAGYDEVALGYESHVLSLTSPTRSVVMRLLPQEHERYPDLSRQFAYEPPASVRLNAKELGPAFKRVDQVKNAETDRISLTFRHDTLIISASQEGRGDSDEEIAVEYDGPDAQLLVKSTLLQSMLNTAPGGEVVMAFNPAAHKPLIVTAPADPAWRFLIMPMRKLG